MADTLVALLTQIQAQAAREALRITLHAFHAQYQSGEVQHLGVANHQWVTLKQLDNYAFAVTDRKIIQALLDSKTR